MWYTLYMKTGYSIKIGNTEIRVFETGKNTRIRQGGKLHSVHTHFAHEIFFVTDGSMRLITDRGVSEYQRAVVIVPPHIKHMSQPDSDGCFCLLFSADIAGIGDGITELPMTDDIAFYIEQLAQKVGTQAAWHLIALLFMSVFEPLLPKNSAPRGRAHISAIEGYINSHLRKKITLSDVAGSVYLSERQVSRIIAKEYGMSFTELIADKRLATAVVLLCNTDMSVSDIAAEVFPGSESYFYTLFKKKYGVSPLKYRAASAAR